MFVKNNSDRFKMFAYLLRGGIAEFRNVLRDWTEFSQNDLVKGFHKYDFYNNQYRIKNYPQEKGVNDGQQVLNF